MAKLYLDNNKVEVDTCFHFYTICNKQPIKIIDWYAQSYLKKRKQDEDLVCYKKIINDEVTYYNSEEMLIDEIEFNTLIKIWKATIILSRMT